MSNISPAIEKFDKVMEEYMKEVTDSDHKDFDLIEKLEEKRQQKINQAQEIMEKELGDEIEEQAKILEKEQEESVIAILELEEADEKELEEDVVDLDESIIARYSGLSIEQILRKYKEKELIADCTSLGIVCKESDTKKDHATRILGIISK